MTLGRTVFGSNGASFTWWYLPANVVREEHLHDPDRLDQPVGAIAIGAREDRGGTRAPSCPPRPRRRAGQPGAAGRGAGQPCPGPIRYTQRGRTYTRAQCAIPGACVGWPRLGPRQSRERRDTRRELGTRAERQGGDSTMAVHRFRRQPVPRSERPWRRRRANRGEARPVIREGRQATHDRTLLHPQWDRRHLLAPSKL